MRKPSSIDFQRVGRIFYSCRRRKGLSQQQAATALNCSLTHYSRIESGYRPSLEMLIDLCTFYDLSIDEVLDLHPAENPYVRELVRLVSPRPLHEQRYLLESARRFFSLMQDIRDHQDYHPYRQAEGGPSSFPYKEAFIGQGDAKAAEEIAPYKR